MSSGGQWRPHLPDESQAVQDAFTRAFNAIYSNQGDINSVASAHSQLAAQVQTTHNSQLRFVATATTISFYWDGTNGSSPMQLINTSKQITTAKQSNLTVSGLMASTTYLFYPVYNPALGVVQFLSESGSIGSPSVAYASPSLYAAAAQTANGVIPLSNGPISVATPASGSTNGFVGGR
jgi:hypothetical protein